MINDTDLKGLRVLHGALVIGCVLALVMPVMVSPSPRIDQPWYTGQFELLGTAGLALIPISFLLFQRALTGVRASTGQAQGTALRATLIVHWALIEGPALFNAAFLFVEPGKGNLLAGAISVVVLAARMPNRSRVDRWCLGN